MKATKSSRKKSKNAKPLTIIHGSTPEDLENIHLKLSD
jgi:hypothetical protein